MATADHTPIPEGFKRCSKCGEFKLATTEYFHAESSVKSGLRTDCKSCNKARALLWRNRHIEQARKADRQYHEMHRELRNAQSKQYRKDHPQQVKARIHQWRKTHREQIKEYGRQWCKDHPEQVIARTRQYRKDHLAQRVIFQQRREALKRTLPATFTTIDWLRALAYFHDCCAVCGRPQGLWHKIVQDHWIPLSRGGAYTPGNIVPLCHGVDGCNNTKKDRDPHKWLVEKYGKRKAAAIEKRICDYFTEMATNTLPERGV